MFRCILDISLINWGFGDGPKTGYYIGELEIKACSMATTKWYYEKHFGPPNLNFIDSMRLFYFNMHDIVVSPPFEVHSITSILKAPLLSNP